jgi:protein-histidine pros-kinase
MLTFRFPSFERPRIPPRSPAAFVFALLVCVPPTSLYFAGYRFLGAFPFLVYLPGVFVTAMLCGMEAAVFAAAVSATIVLFWIAQSLPPLEIARRGIFFTVAVGTVVGVIVTMRRSARQLRQLNEELQASEAKFRALLESAPDAMVILDPEGRIALVNAEAERLFGYDRSELIRREPQLLMPDSEEPRSSSGELVGVRKNGDAIPIEVRHGPLEMESGRMVSIAIRDITERKRIEADLAAANRAKSDFLASMSHELRTPLNAIVGFGELLLHLKGDDEATQRQKEYVELILEGGGHLRLLVSQLLDLASIEAGRLHLDIEPVNVRAALDEAHELIQPLALKACIKVLMAYPDDPVAVLADPFRLRQVLLNFLSNGIKYNRPDGTVVLSVRSAVKGAVRITVSDTGIGIPAGRESELFQPFHRLGAELSHVEGAGIGLAYSRKLVEAMNGAVGYSSRPGEGSEFWLELPAFAGA